MDSGLEYEDRAAGSVGLLRHHIQELAVRTSGPSKVQWRPHSSGLRLHCLTDGRYLSPKRRSPCSLGFYFAYCSPSNPHIDAGGHHAYFKFGLQRLHRLHTGHLYYDEVL
ncbi:hypothetical protein MTO96_040080 [Rhipicephalus appendiculatus]